MGFPIAQEKNMVVNQQKQAFGVFSQSQTAEEALNKLKASSFPMDKVSVIARDAEEGEQLSGAQTSDHIGGKDVEAPTAIVETTRSTAVWGTILVGLTSLALPGIGPILAAGTLGTALLATAAGTGVGAIAASGLVKAFTNLGIPQDKARVYSDRLQHGDYLVIVQGSNDEIQQAEEIFSSQGIEDWGIYSFLEA